MRTTLDLDDEVLAVARSLAASRGISIGAAVSLLARQGMERGSQPPVDFAYSPFPVLVGEAGHVVTDELIAQHRDD